MTPLELMRKFDALTIEDRENLIVLAGLRDFDGLRKMKREAFEADNARAVELITLAIEFKRYQELRKGLTP